MRQNDVNSVVSRMAQMALTEFMETIGVTSENGECLGDMQLFLDERGKHPYLDDMNEEEQNDAIRRVYKSEYFEFISGEVIDSLRKKVEKMIMEA